MRRHQEFSQSSRASSASYEPHNMKTNSPSRAASSRESRHAHPREHNDPRHLSQGDINRLALQHADSSKLPLNAENLELLIRQQDTLEQASKHGGSAALLHASRSRPGRRENLPYSRLDERGNPTTTTFRPNRASGSDLYLVQVEEEEEDDERRPNSLRVVKHGVRRSDEESRKHVEDRHRREQGAVEIAHSGDHRFYKIQ